MGHISQSGSPPAASRETIHDLRNLFGVVASARHLLDHRRSEADRTMLLDAIERAAIHGSELTTQLLACSPGQPQAVDVNATVRSLQPMIEALAGQGLPATFDLCSERVSSRIHSRDLEAALLELVRNAHTAAGSDAHLAIRTRARGGKIWIAVADDGPGMSRDTKDMIERASGCGASGTGLQRVRRFALAAHGRFRIFSRSGHGTVVVLSLPALLSIAAAAQSIGTADRRRPIQPIDRSRSSTPKVAKAV